MVPPTPGNTTVGVGPGRSVASESLRLRSATIGDLDTINNIVAAAMKSWRLSERVIRLSLPLYRYSEGDFAHQQILLAEIGCAIPAGMAAIESADNLEYNAAGNPALLHGIYIHPRYHRLGIGSELLQRAQEIARSTGFDGLLVRAMAEATTFFEVNGFLRVAVENAEREYQHRYWKALTR